MMTFAPEYLCELGWMMPPLSLLRNKPSRPRRWAFADNRRGMAVHWSQPPPPLSLSVCVCLSRTIASGKPWWVRMDCIQYGIRYCREGNILRRREHAAREVNRAPSSPRKGKSRSGRRRGSCAM
ncbi:hypothetical protein N658DRAFT_216544 [Parathielavia hyrcaniae]|uniref:Uncharacterized protein n=1 Tax=Parathielavia hyrcaniae TaxID=113614 RepID=A0AAN6PYS7_9PEZI|nr:hypothetical protein N658DRAFT_216544 [Parathielavia hyrcaniae]